MDGFPQSTLQLEQRQLNPFNDVNTFGATDRVTRRPLDTKGELGARPVQQWKEMLREGMQYRKSHTWKIPDFEPWMPGSVADPSNPLHAFLDERSIQETRRRLIQSAERQARIVRRGGRSSSTPRGGGSSEKGSARSGATPRGSTPRGGSRSGSTPRGGRRSASAGRTRSGAAGNISRQMLHDGSSPFLRSGAGRGGTVSSRARSASPPNIDRPRFIKTDSGPFGTFGDGSRSAIAVQLPPSALPPQRRTQSPLTAHQRLSEGGQFGFWGGRSSVPSRRARSQSPGRHEHGDGAMTTVLATTAGAPGTSTPSASAAGGSSAALARSPLDPRRALVLRAQESDHALVLARARGRSPTRWGPAGERRLSVADRPGWRPVSGFPDNTVITEHRKLDPFADINSYSAYQGHMGARPLDCKGMNGARPLQQWKEMLRNGSR